MKAGRFFVTGWLFFTLFMTACGAVKDVKDANNMEKEGNRLIAETSAERTALNKDHGIYLYTIFTVDSEATDFNWVAKTPEVRKSIRDRLNIYSLKVSRIIEIGKHKNMKLAGSEGLDMSRSNAQRFLSSLDKYEAKTR